jgi:hypothetical protein
MVETDAYVVEKYRKFVRHMMLSDWADHVSELIDAIETDTVNNNALAYHSLRLPIRKLYRGTKTDRVILSR